MVDRRLRQHRYPERHHLRTPVVRAHLDVVNANQQRLDRPAALLVAHRDRVQIQVDQDRHKLQRKTPQLDLTGPVEATQLVADWVDELKVEIFWISSDLIF